MEAAFKLAGAAFIAMSAALLVKQSKNDFFSLVGIGAAVSAGIYAAAVMGGLLKSWINTAYGYGVESELLGTAVKITGICIVCSFAAGCCREAGLTALAGNVELVGKLGIAATVFPLAINLLQLLSEVI